jgi:hypothetical protein
MSRPDPFLNLLKDFGYLPLRLPRADVQPLQLLNVSNKDFALLGDLADAVSAGDGATLPEIKTDIPTAGQIQGTRSSTVKLSIGLNLLGNILGALTGNNLDVSAAYKDASNLTFEFADVTVNNVSIVQLDKFLNLSKLDSVAKQIQDLMLAGNAGVTTAVARTKKYIISAQDDHGVDVNADVPVIKGIAGGKLAVSTAGSKNEKVVFEGPAPVTFGVQAVRLGFDDKGHISAIDPFAVGSGAVRGLEMTGGGAPNIITIEGMFADIS